MTDPIAKAIEVLEPIVSELRDAEANASAGGRDVSHPALVNNPIGNPGRILFAAEGALIYSDDLYRAAEALAGLKEMQATHWLAPRELTDELADIALSVTASHLDIKGSGLTVNREKMKRRFARLRDRYLEAKP